MQFANIWKIIAWIVALLIFIAFFKLFDFFAKLYDKKHPNAKGISGHYKTPKASYSYTKGESIFHIAFFLIGAPILFIVFLWLYSLFFE